MPNLLMARASTSDCSWPAAACGLVSSMFQSLFQMRIVDGEQRPLLQLPEERGDPETAQTNRRYQIEPMNMKSSLVKERALRSRTGRPGAGEETHSATLRISLFVPFEIAREQ